MNILIVEDDADARLLCAKALRAEDHVISEAGSGQEALERLAQGPLPDVILLDLTLPDMDGKDFMKELKAHPDWRAIRVVLVSGWDDLASIAQELGADDALSKPFGLDELYNAVEKTHTSGGSAHGI